MQWAHLVYIVVENKNEWICSDVAPITNQVQPNQTSGLCLLVIQSVAGMVEGYPL